MQTIRIDLIDRDPNQPRTEFDAATLADLANSIAQLGLIQPIVVRPNGDRFTVLVGERRWRAAGIAGLLEVPAVVSNITDPLAILQMQIEENQAREELSLWEEATAVAAALRKHNISASELASRWGWHKTKLSRLAAIAKLDDQRAELVRTNRVRDENAAAYLRSIPDELMPKVARLERTSFARLQQLHAEWQRRTETPSPTSPTPAEAPRPTTNATEDFLNAFSQPAAQEAPDRYTLDLTEDSARELARRLGLDPAGHIDSVLAEISLSLEPIPA